MYYAKPIELARWSAKAKKLDLTYHRNRRILWDDFTRAVRVGFNMGYGYVPIPTGLYNSVSSALTVRNNELTDDKRLAFTTAVDEFLESAEEWVVNSEQDIDYNPEPQRERERILERRAAREDQATDLVDRRRPGGQQRLQPTRSHTTTATPTTSVQTAPTTTTSTTTNVFRELFAELPGGSGS